MYMSTGSENLRKTIKKEKNIQGKAKKNHDVLMFSYDFLIVSYEEIHQMF